MTPDDEWQLCFLISELVCEGQGINAIRDAVPSRFGKLNHDQILKYIKKAADPTNKRATLRLIPPLETTLRNELARQFGQKPERLTVVGTETDGPIQDHVCMRAAEVVFQMIEQVASHRRQSASDRGVVGLGLGPGFSTLQVVRFLGQIVRERIAETPRLRLHAITSGCPYDRAERAPNNFFNYFPTEALDATMPTVGLFALPVMSNRRFQELLADPPPGLREPISERDNIDIVVTGLGVHNDSSSTFHEMMSGVNFVQELEGRGWLFDVQFRPLDNQGKPMAEQSDDDQRCFTLFDIADFQQMVSAAPQRQVVLLVQARADDLEPVRDARIRTLEALLTSPDRCWSHLVIHSHLAKSVLDRRGVRSAPRLA